jgi:hypothetical protein
VTDGEDYRTVQLAHDKRVCIFGAQEITSARNGGTFVPDDYPDETERVAKAVDLLGHDDIGPIVAEHTVIESYAHQIHDNSRIGEFLPGFADRFGNSLAAPGHYTLCIHPQGIAGVPRKKMAQALDELEIWVRMQQIPSPKIPLREPNHVEASPPSVPFPVTLFRFQCAPEDDGSLNTGLLGSGDREAGRIERVRDAFRDKTPKLEAARVADGITLLVLENRDFIMANPVVIAQAVGAVGSTYSPVPDAIVCVDTTAGEGCWLTYRIKMKDWWSPAALDGLATVHAASDIG